MGVGTNQILLSILVQSVQSAGASRFCETVESDPWRLGEVLEEIQNVSQHCSPQMTSTVTSRFYQTIEQLDLYLCKKILSFKERHILLNVMTQVIYNATFSKIVGP